MKKIAFLGVFLTLAAVLFPACSAGQKAPGSFDTAVEVRGDSIAVHEILKPTFLLEGAAWSVVGDKAVIMSEASNDSLVYVYRLPDFKFLYAGIRAGNGPEDIDGSYYAVVPRQADSLVLFWNASLFGMFATLTDTGFVVGSRVEGTYDRIQERIPAADSMQLDINSTQYDMYHLYLYLYDLNQKQKLDSVGTAHQIFTEKQRQYEFYRNMPRTIGNGTLYAAVYPFTGRVEFYDVATGKILLKKAVGDNTPVEELKEKNFANYPIYDQVASDGKYLYVLESLRREKKITDCNILVYDWQGNPVGKYHPDKLIHAILAYQGKVYGYNKDMDFEQVYVYDLKL